MNNIIREDLQHFVAYSSARDEAKATPKNNIWLNANESPFDVEIARDVKINRYPEKQSQNLRNQVAELFSVKASELVISRGSDEMIDLLVRLCCTAGKDNIVICPPTYGMYAVSARLQNAGVVQVPLLKQNNFQLDINKITEKYDNNIKIIFICSPNNPTGNVINPDDIFSLCERFKDKSLIVVDEAYIEYADAESLSRYINTYKNLVILRTFSKAYGLAGVRMGFLVANEALVDWVLKVIAPYPLSSIVTEYVLNTLSLLRVNQIQEQVSLIRTERLRLVDVLRGLPWVKKIWPSEANFILIETTDAKNIMQICAEAGIVIREMFDKPGLDNAIRISVGTPEQNDCVITVLREVK